MDDLTSRLPDEDVRDLKRRCEARRKRATNPAVTLDGVRVDTLLHLLCAYEKLGRMSERLRSREAGL